MNTAWSYSPGNMFITLQTRMKDNKNICSEQLLWLWGRNTEQNTSSSQQFMNTDHLELKDLSWSNFNF